jgi:hypothetical protein
MPTRCLMLKETGRDATADQRRSARDAEARCTSLGDAMTAPSCNVEESLIPLATKGELVNELLWLARRGG